MIADLNVSISPSDFTFVAAFWQIWGSLAFLPSLSFQMVCFSYLLLIPYSFGMCEERTQSAGVWRIVALPAGAFWRVKAWDLL